MKHSTQWIESKIFDWMFMLRLRFRVKTKMAALRVPSLEASCARVPTWEKRLKTVFIVKRSKYLFTQMVKIVYGDGKNVVWIAVRVFKRPSGNYKQYASIYVDDNRVLASCTDVQLIHEGRTVGHSCSTRVLTHSSSLDLMILKLCFQHLHFELLVVFSSYFKSPCLRRGVTAVGVAVST